MPVRYQKIILFLMIIVSFMSALAIVYVLIRIPLVVSLVVAGTLPLALTIVMLRKPRKFKGGFWGKVSIVIPAKNEEAVIERTIMAIEESKYPNFDLIIINDGSTDKTAEIIDALATRYGNIKTIHIPPKELVHGKVAGLNRASKFVDGDVVLVLDADVLVDKNYLLEALKPFEDEKTGFIQTGIRTYSKGKLVYSICDSDLAVTNVFMEYFLKPRSFGTGFLIRSDIFKKVLPLNENSISDDRQMSIELNEFGVKGIFNPTVFSYQSSPVDLKSLWCQRKRWFLGDLVEILRTSKGNFVLSAFSIFIIDMFVASVFFWPLSFSSVITLSVLFSLLWLVMFNSKRFRISSVFIVWGGAVASYFIDLISLTFCVFVVPLRFDKKMAWYKTSREKTR